MNPFVEIHARLSSSAQAPNVFLMGAADRVPCRVVIENPTDSQLATAANLAAEFELEFMAGEDDAVIMREDEQECAFFTI